LFDRLPKRRRRHHPGRTTTTHAPVKRLLKATSPTGWVAIAPLGAVARVAHVVRPEGERPALRWACEAAWGDPTLALRGLRRSRGLQRQRTVAVLQRSQYQLLTMDAPEVPRDEWRDALRWRLKDMVEFAVDTAGIDVLEVPAAAAQRRTPSVIAVAAAHATLAPLADAASDAGVPWQAIDVTETALRNLCALTEEPGRGQALLQVGATDSTLVVTWQGELLLSRHIDVTLPQLTDADESVRQQSFERASLELQRTLDGVERQFAHASLAQVQVAPGAPLDEFIRYVSDLVYVPVTGFDLARWVDLGATPELADATAQAAYLPAIGAALRDA
jgi:MSHA biogenesis protein MshI